MLNSKNVELVGSVDRCDTEQISGWAYDKNNPAPVMVEILVNGAVLGAVRANNYRKDLEKVRPDGKFAFTAYLKLSERKLLKYLPENSEVIVRFASSKQLLTRGIFYLVGENTNPSRLFVDEHGAAFGLNKGVLVVPISVRSAEWRIALMQLYKQLCRDAKSLDKDLVLAYGGLLGAARTGTLIPHDDDLDCALICTSTEMFGAAEEFARFLDGLEQIGYTCKRLSNGQAHLFHSKYPDCEIDLFLSWFQDERYCLSFAVMKGLARDDVFPLTPIKLEGQDVLTVFQYKKLLAQTYGPTWETPDQAFSWTLGLEVKNFFAPIHNYQINKNKEYWQSYYSTSFGLRNYSSQFAIFCAGILGIEGETSNFVLDIGSGDGRDSFFFQSIGCDTIGTDFEPSVVARCNEKAVAMGAAGISLQFQCINVANLKDMAQLMQIVKNSRKSKRLLIYSRFFMHAIDEHAQAAVIRFCRELLAVGDICAFEFRTDVDKKGEKITAEHFRRYIKPVEFIWELNLNGLKATYFAEGRGYANYKGDDAHVARIVCELAR